MKSSNDDFTDPNTWDVRKGYREDIPGIDEFIWRTKVINDAVRLATNKKIELYIVNHDGFFRIYGERPDVSEAKIVKEIKP